MQILDWLLNSWTLVTEEFLLHHMCFSFCADHVMFVLSSWWRCKLTCRGEEGLNWHMPSSCLLFMKYCGAIIMIYEGKQTMVQVCSSVTIYIYIYTMIIYFNTSDLCVSDLQTYRTNLQDVCLRTGNHVID